MVLSVLLLRIHNFTDSDRQYTTQFERMTIDREETLETWLHRNPELILDEQVFLIGRQGRLDTGVADLVGLDRWGNVIVFEVKIGRSGSGSASEKSILSQPQNYAQSLSSYDYENLNELYQDHRARLTRGEWDVSEGSDRGGNLLIGFETAFGESIEPDQFNSTQRMVVIAEDVTRRTEQNVRYLLEEGLNFQCVEIQAFSSPSGDDTETMIASSTVVDYPQGRVRPKDRPSPTYLRLVNDLLERAYPDFRSVTSAASVGELFPEGIDVREPRLVSQNVDHPTSIRYRLAPKPDDGTVVIAIDAKGNSVDGVSELQRMRAEFEEQGLDITGNQTYRVVTRKWEIEGADDLDEDLRDEIADAFATLVRLGHEAFTDPQGETHD
jgi:hypothetical protein